MTILKTTVFQLPYPDGSELVKQGDNAIAALAAAIELALSPPWVSLVPSLQSGFAAAAGYQVPSYQLFADGRVRFRGGISRGSNLTSGLVPIILPAEIRSTSIVSVPFVATRSATTSGSPTGQAIISTNGNVTIYVDNTVVSNFFVLDGVQYSK